MNTSTSPRQPLPPFTFETASAKVRSAEDAWNGREPERVAMAYSPESRWRNRSEFFAGRDAIREFLVRKWAREREYRYESHDPDGQWWRSFGNEQWEFDELGYMRRREASINDVKIAEEERLFRWPLGPRPAGHPGLTELDLP